MLRRFSTNINQYTPKKIPANVFFMRHNQWWDSPGVTLSETTWKHTAMLKITLGCLARAVKSTKLRATSPPEVILWLPTNTISELFVLLQYVPVTSERRRLIQLSPSAVWATWRQRKTLKYYCTRGTYMFLHFIPKRMYRVHRGGGGEKCHL